MSAIEGLVSVVVPTFNYGQYLLTCLDAIWHQEVPELELIVVNAASTDNTRELLDDWQARIGTETVDYARCWNEDTGEVVSEIPPEHIQKLSERLDEMKHLLVDEVG